MFENAPSNMPPKLPISDSVRALNVERASSLIFSVARLAASMLTPASAYVTALVISERGHPCPHERVGANYLESEDLSVLRTLCGQGCPRSIKVPHFLDCLAFGG